MSDYEEKDYRSEMDDLIAMWGEMESSGMNPEPQSPQKLPSRDDYGDNPTDMYYSYFDDQHGAVDDVPTDIHMDADQEALLQEEKLKTPNPVYPDSAGPDYQTTQPVWVSEEAFKEIEKLKGRLFDVENKIAKQMGGGEKWVEKCHHPNDKKLLSELESLRKRIEKVSSALGVEDEQSPWYTQRD